MKSVGRKFNVDVRTIRRLKRRSQTESLSRKKGSGRKRKPNLEDEQKLDELFQQNGTVTSKKLSSEIENEFEISITSRTIGNY